MVASNSSDRKRVGNAILGTAVFLALAPGFVAGIVPGLITGWEVRAHLPAPFRALGAVVCLVGISFLLHAFARFALEGLGTPAPVAPTERLVVGGVYRHVRNPMYLAVGSTIVGQALLFGQPELLAYAALFGALVYSFVRFYEEPTLTQQFGADYRAYRR